MPVNARKATESTAVVLEQDVEELDRA